MSIIKVDDLGFDDITLDQAVEQYNANYQKVMNVIPEPVKLDDKKPRQSSGPRKSRESKGFSELEQNIVDFLTNFDTWDSPSDIWYSLGDLRYQYSPKQVTNKLWAMAKKGILDNANGTYRIHKESGVQ